MISPPTMANRGEYLRELVHWSRFVAQNGKIHSNRFDRVLRHLLHKMQGTPQLKARVDAALSGTGHRSGWHRYGEWRQSVPKRNLHDDDLSTIALREVFAKLTPSELEIVANMKSAKKLIGMIEKERAIGTDLLVNYMKWPKAGQIMEQKNMLDQAAVLEQKIYAEFPRLRNTIKKEGYTAEQRLYSLLKKMDERERGIASHWAELRLYTLDLERGLSLTKITRRGAEMTLDNSILYGSRVRNSRLRSRAQPKTADEALKEANEAVPLFEAGEIEAVLRRRGVALEEKLVALRSAHQQGKVVDEALLKFAEIGRDRMIVGAAIKYTPEYQGLIKRTMENPLWAPKDLTRFGFRLAHEWFPGWADRIMGDPRFVMNILIEEAAALTTTFMQIHDHYGGIEGMKADAGVVATDVITVFFINAALVYFLTPKLSKRYVNVANSSGKGIKSWLNPAHQPGNFAEGLFTHAGRQRYGVGHRTASFIYKGALFGAAGAAAGAASNTIVRGIRALQGKEPEGLVSRLENAGDWGSFMALSSNTRYQGIKFVEELLDRLAWNRSFVGALTGTVILRGGNALIGPRDYYKRHKQWFEMTWCDITGESYAQRVVDRNERKLSKLAEQYGSDLSEDELNELKDLEAEIEYYRQILAEEQAEQEFSQTDSLDAELDELAGEEEEAEVSEDA